MDREYVYARGPQPATDRSSGRMALVNQAGVDGAARRDFGVPGRGPWPRAGDCR